jgi:hypothetical protein
MTSATAFNFGLVFGFLIFFFGVATLAMLLTRRLSGWYDLSLRFSTEKFPGPYITPWAATLRCNTNLNGCLKIRSTPEALSLAVLPVFGLFLKPLSIPWREIEEERSPWWHFFQPVTFRLGSEEQIPLRISRKIAARIREAAGRKIEAV